MEIEDNSGFKITIPDEIAKTITAYNNFNPLFTIRFGFYVPFPHLKADKLVFIVRYIFRETYIGGCSPQSNPLPIREDFYDFHEVMTYAIDQLRGFNGRLTEDKRLDFLAKLDEFTDTSVYRKELRAYCYIDF
jgi:hypothetical protein